MQEWFKGVRTTSPPPFSVGRKFLYPLYSQVRLSIYTALEKIVSIYVDTVGLVRLNSRQFMNIVWRGFRQNPNTLPHKPRPLWKILRTPLNWKYMHCKSWLQIQLCVQSMLTCETCVNIHVQYIGMHERILWASSDIKSELVSGNRQDLHAWEKNTSCTLVSQLAQVRHTISPRITSVQKSLFPWEFSQ